MLKDNLNDSEVEFIALITDKHALNYAICAYRTLKIKPKVEISALPLAAVCDLKCVPLLVNKGSQSIVFTRGRCQKKYKITAARVTRNVS